MNSSEKNFRSDFDEQWREALEGAEMVPPKSVWDAVDSNLNKAEAMRFKKYYIFYRSAAAVLLFLSLAGLAAYYQFGNIQPEYTKSQDIELQPEELIVNQPTENQTVEGLQKETALPAENPENISSEDGQQQASLLALEQKHNTTAASNSVGNGSNGAPTTANGNFPTQKDQELAAATTSVYSRQANRGTGVVGINSIAATENDENTETINPLAASTSVLAFAQDDDFVVESKGIALQEVRDVEYGHMHIDESKMWYNRPEVRSKKVKNTGNSFFANVNLNSDFFNPNFSKATVASNNYLAFDGGNKANGVYNNDGYENMAVNNRVSQSEMGVENSPQASFTYGINVGMKVSEHWMIEGGVNYSNYNTTTATTATVSDGELNNNLPLTIQNERPELTADISNPKLYHTGEEHEITNSFEFASIPMTAGYVIGIQKFNLIFKAGMSTDFFLRNEISDKNDQLNRVEMRAGNDSPFNRVMLSGVIGNEINYMLDKHYSFSLSANYRKFLNSFSKSNAGFNSNPSSYGLGMVFRYHFE
ncbi:outer membrane beta-barrel protein [Flammeovirgaceae bacterium SG7u.111]|nr:outer membrane beta-barrel protein [Flammeovirgaceae bacterium SG7u.132]WPO37510.1 outer membrane beta-barrel protein [Flammeovirgaceae bacterium SG7u.111]